MDSSGRFTEIETFGLGDAFGRRFTEASGTAWGGDGGGLPDNVIVNDYEDGGPLVNDYEDSGFIINDFEA